MVADCVEKLVVQPASDATCCHAPASNVSLLRHALVAPLASGIETPRAFMASAMRARASGGILESAACSGAATSWPSASSTDILTSQSPGFTGGTGNGPAAAAASARHGRTDDAARRMAIRRMDGSSQRPAIVSHVEAIPRTCPVQSSNALRSCADGLEIQILSLNLGLRQRCV